MVTGDDSFDDWQSTKNAVIYNAEEDDRLLMAPSHASYNAEDYGDPLTLLNPLLKQPPCYYAEEAAADSSGGTQSEENDPTNKNHAPHASNDAVDDDDDSDLWMLLKSLSERDRASTKDEMPNVSSRGEVDRAKGKKAKRKRTVVQHTYQDHAKDPIEELIVFDDGPCDISKPFPFILHDLLQDCSEISEWTKTVSWTQPHGRSFTVHNRKEFEATIMPLYFQGKTMESFLRQLSYYGFLRVNNHCEYYHQFFLEGRQDLCRHIQRKRIKGTLVRASSNPDAEPDFTAMPSVRPVS